MPRAAFKPNQEQRKLVETLSGYGLTEQQIAHTVGDKGIDPKTLRKHFRCELDRGLAKATAALAQAAYKKALAGDGPILKFLLRCRGFKEVNVIQHTGPQGGPMEMNYVQEQQQQLADELARLAASAGAMPISEPPDTTASADPDESMAGLPRAA